MKGSGDTIKRSFLFITIFIISTVLTAEKVVFYEKEILGVKFITGAFYNTLERPVDSGVFKDAKRIEKEIVPSPATILLLNNGVSPTILVVPGLDICQNGKEGVYKDRFIDAIKEAIKKSGIKNSIYFYSYPSIFESYWESGKRLADFIKRFKFKDLYVIAHSKGGLVVRVALLDEDARKQIKKVVFLGTPHLGTPFADALKVPPSSFEEYFKVSREEAEFLRTSLVMSYTAGYVNSIGSKELSWMDTMLPPFENYDNIEFVLIAGMIEHKSLKDIENYLSSNFMPSSFGPFIGLFYLSLVSDILIPKYEKIAATDGLVPVISALALGKLKGKKIVINGFNHASLIYKVDFLVKVLKNEY